MYLDLADLPQECIEAVAEYLELDDVLACSGVSKKWRSAFNKNSIWRRYHTINQKYFDKQVSLLGHSSEDFSEGCEAKQHFFKESLVYKNLKQGKLHAKYIEFGKKYWVLCGTDTVDKDGNHMLFILVMYMENNYSITNTSLQMWNLNEEPALLTFIKFDRSTKLPHHLKANCEKLFYINIFFVLVYGYCNLESSLNFLFKVEIPDLWGTALQKPPFVFTSNMIVGFFHSSFSSTQLVSPLVHVWDMKGALLYTSDTSGMPVEEENISAPTKIFKIQWKYSTNSRFVGVLSSWYVETTQTHILLDLFSLDDFQFINIESMPAQGIYQFGFLTSQLCVRYNTENTTVIILYNLEDIKKFRNPQENSACACSFLPSTDKEIVLVDLGASTIVVDFYQQKEAIKFFTVSGNPIVVKRAMTLKNNLLVVKSCDVSSTTPSASIGVWNYKSGRLLGSSNLPDIRERDSYDYNSFSFSEHSDEFFPKVMAIQMCDESKTNRVLVGSFW